MTRDETHNLVISCILIVPEQWINSITQQKPVLKPTSTTTLSFCRVYNAHEQRLCFAGGIASVAQETPEIKYYIHPSKYLF